MSNHHFTEASCQIGLAAFWQSVGIFAKLAGEQTSSVKGDFPTQNPPANTQTILQQAEKLAAGETLTPSEPATATQQLTLFEQIRLDGKYPELDKLKYVYPLQALSVKSLFPVQKGTPPETKDYATLWEAFCHALHEIPKAHRTHLPLWLDHFDTLWQVYAHTIPSPVASISLYDYTHTTAALAVALWRYQQAEQTNEQGNEFLLVQGDFFGIQDFIFASGGETRKRAAKLLRGRSFYVSLLMECAALRIMDSLGLPSTSQVTNAAGKFLIVAPNTQETIDQLQAIQQQFNEWFLEHTFGQSGIGLAWLPAKGSDFSHSNFGHLMNRLFEQLETVKLQRFDLCNASNAVFDSEFLSRFAHGECKVDGRSPAFVEKDNIWISKLAADQIDTGTFLTNSERLLMTRHPTGMNKVLSLPIFDFCISFTGNEDKSGNFEQLARENKLLRVIDFSLIDQEDKSLWHGYARRAINAWIPKATEQDFLEAQWGKYKDVEDELVIDTAKTLNHLACEDKVPNQDKTGSIGIASLMTLKGDVDDLGTIFKDGLDKPSFAKTAALSRQMNAFFSIWLPYLCQTKFPNIYTVFAGGDDFFLIGPWHSTIKLAQLMQTEFKRYVGENEQVHFSAGLAMTKSGTPINYLADIAETALHKAKMHNFDPNKDKKAPKNAVTCFGCSVSWDNFGKLLQGAAQLNEMREDFDLSTSYLYGLLHLVKLREELDKKPANSIWQSRFQYRTWRMLETRRRDGRKLDEAERRRLQTKLSYAIANQGIEKHKGNYRIALFTHLYQHRR